MKIAVGVLCILFALHLSSSTIVIGNIANLVDRGDETKYNVVLLEPDDKRLNEIQLEGNEVDMVSSVDKKRYKCTIPNDQPDEDQSKTTTVKMPSARKILEPLAGPCLYRLEGWWNYEFCFGKHVRQFHQEPNQPVRPQDDYLLGKSSHPVVVREDDDESLDSEEDQGEEIGELKPDYYAEKYEGGTPCDITGAPRTSEVRFYCGDGHVTSAINDIKEPSSCNYIVTIVTPLLCKHPKYKPKKQKTQTMYCIHQLTEEEKLQKKKEEEELNRKLEEAKRELEEMSRLSPDVDDEEEPIEGAAATPPPKDIKEDAQPQENEINPYAFLQQMMADAQQEVLGQMAVDLLLEHLKKHKVDGDNFNWEVEDVVIEKVEVTPQSAEEPQQVEGKPNIQQENEMKEEPKVASGETKKPESNSDQAKDSIPIVESKVVPKTTEEAGKVESQQEKKVASEQATKQEPARKQEEPPKKVEDQPPHKEEEAAKILEGEQVKKADTQPGSKVETEQVKKVETEQAKKDETEQVKKVEPEQVKKVETEQPKKVEDKHIEKKQNTEQTPAKDASTVKGSER